ncbi:serine/threonine-protein kinase [Kordiimonas lacus]|uniref:Serine/threonine protein kinase n=1 Tax=Kordiimonas lacus TaxID=637679 RepID=A0A1G7A4S0_9PROT|nr:serine/threonine-protein kinase [Kordiimonas lacus]SDE09874.1 serine/threonine protein kinase [Kordiimonas lacus]
MAEAIGRYQLGETVGKGAYGTVYRAEDTLLDRSVAIKLLNKSVSDGADPKASLVEAKTLAKLNHPNIVTLYEISEHDGHTVMVMEYLDGEPLKDYLARTSPSFDDRLALVRQLADALRASHSLGIVHADIKPGNIIMRSGGVPVLVDFGLAKTAPTANDMETLTRGSLGQSLILGTLPYMAPEVMKGGKPDEVSDIFSFGALLYEVLTGERAFKAGSDAEIVHLILNEDPAPVSTHAPDAPAWCANLVARMLSKERAARPQTFADVLKAIDSADPGTPLRDRKAADKAKRLLSLKRIAAAAAIAIALGAGFVGSRYMGDEPLTVSGRIEAGMDRLRNSQEKGAIEEAKAYFQSILTEDPENAAATAGYSLALLTEYSSSKSDQKLLDDGMAAAQLSIGLDNQLSLAHAVAGWAFEFSGKMDEAQSEYQIALNLDPKNYFALLGNGRLSLGEGNLAEAIRRFETANQLYSSDTRLLIYLGDLYFRSGSYEVAEQRIRQAISKAPDNVYSYKTLSAILFAKGDTIGAIGAAQQGLQIRPDPMLYNNLGSFYFSLGQYAQSVQAFERAIDAQGNSHNYFLWANLGDAYSMIKGSNGDAKLAYRRAIQLLTPQIKPDDTRPAVFSRAGLYYAKAEQLEEALAMTYRALELAPEDRYVLFRASVVMEQTGDREKALKFLEHSIDAGQPVNEIQNEPYLNALREDPAYHKLLASQPSK